MAQASSGASAHSRPIDPPDPAFSTTLAHGLDVLAAFRNSSGSLSNADLALHTGLSRPTVSRLTYTLAQLGYLKRNDKGRFELGLGILAAAYPVLSALKVRQMARPLMRDFAAYAGGTVSIAMPFGLDFIYVETLRTTDAVPHVPDVGFTGSMATTAVGRALLSLFTTDELARYVQTVKAERPEEFDYVQTRTLPDIELCKERGFGAFPRSASAPSRSSASAGHGFLGLPAASDRWPPTCRERRSRTSQRKQKAHRSNDVVILGG
jgi:DNA-binding IclR family transcriptional regulator